MPPQTGKRSSNILQFLLIFALVYVGSQFLLERFFPGRFGGEQAARPPLELQAPGVKGGHHPVLTFRNNTQTGITLADRCPLPPVEVFRVEGAGSGELVPLTPAAGEDDSALAANASKNTVPCVAPSAAPPGGSVALSLAPWKYSLFDDFGAYEVRLPLPSETLTARFQITEPGGLTKAFRTFITKPFLNFLIFIAGVIPGHDLGWAIIFLTLAVKLLLFLPTQHALEGQKKMQMLQPKLDALKKQYGSDAQKIQEETVKLWKEHKVNPFQSCLPTLIQFPILIGLFYVIRDGSVLELSRHLIYPVYQDLSWRFDTSFFGLDLLKPNLWLMPPLLVLLQFLQMKLTFAIAERKKKKDQKVIDVGENKKDPLSATELQQKVFLYVFPLMIGIFAFQFPSAVSLYWGVSTLFAIGQQMIVNREHLRV